MKSNVKATSLTNGCCYFLLNYSTQSDVKHQRNSHSLLLSVNEPLRSIHTERRLHLISPFDGCNHLMWIVCWKLIVPIFFAEIIVVANDQCKRALTLTLSRDLLQCCVASPCLHVRPHIGFCHRDVKLLPFVWPDLSSTGCLEYSRK